MLLRFCFNSVSCVALNSQFSCLSQSSTGIKLCTTMASSLKNLFKNILFWIMCIMRVSVCVCVCICGHDSVPQGPKGVVRAPGAGWSAWHECWEPNKSPKAVHTLNSWVISPALSFTSLKHGWVWLSSIPSACRRPWVPSPAWQKKKLPPNKQLPRKIKLVA